MEPEVAKRLCFEDVSMHSPHAAFTRFEAQRCRAQPSVEQLRSVLADLSRTSDSFSNMVAEAATAQVGNTDADLKRVKYAVTNLKGGVQELDAHARFLEGLLDASALENMATEEDSDKWSEQVKAQKAELDVLRLQTEERIAALTAEVAAFEEGRAKALAQVDALPTANAAVPAQRGRRYTAVPLTPPDEGMEHLEETRAVLAATEQALAAEEAAAAGSLSDAAAAEAGVRALEAHLSAMRQAAAAAEQQTGGHTSMVEYSAPAAGGVLPAAGHGDDGSRSAAQVAHALSEVVVLLRSLGGLDVVSARPDALVLRCAAGPGGVAHVLALRLEAATAKVCSAALEPPGSVSQQALDAVVSQAQGKVHVIVREVLAQLEGLA